MTIRRSRVFFPCAASYCAVLVGLTAAMLTASASAEEAPPRPGRLVGTVTVRGTNEPVKGAHIHVLIGKDKLGVGYTQVEASTDANGRYVLELPMGHARLFAQMLPAGYWAAYGGIEDFVTTPEAPEYTKHYRVDRSPSWRVRIDVEEEMAPLLSDIFVSGRNFTTTPFFLVQAKVDKSGRSLLTLPEAGGDYDVVFYHRDMKLVSKAPAKLSIEPGFQPQRVVGATRKNETAALIFEDDAGRKATLTAADGAVVEGCAEIRLRAADRNEDETFAVTGRVVDHEGRPLAEAIVALGSQNPQGASAMSQFHAQSDEKGRFTISGVSKTMSQDQLLLLMVTHEGFAGIDTRPKPVPEDIGDKPLDFGTIKLAPGHEARLRVVDPQGNPVLGAWVEPSGSYAARTEFHRTDAEGRCTIRNLALGIQKASVRFGQTYAEAHMIVTPKDADETLVRLAPLPKPSVTTTETNDKPLAVGEELPEWEIAAWTDGVTRKLSDFRGKVVVIDVWGIWCSSCVHGIPGLQEVQERFRDRDVVFLSIHTAGTDINQVRKLMKLKEWNWPTGLDAGDQILSSVTAGCYGIKGYPTTLVVGRDGRVAFTTDDETMSDRDAGLKEMERLAKELDIPWPFPEDAAPEEVIPLLNRMMAHKLSTAVEAALQAP